jgi:hypothetical protein
VACGFLSGADLLVRIRWLDSLLFTLRLSNAVDIKTDPCFFAAYIAESLSRLIKSTLIAKFEVIRHNELFVGIQIDPVLDIDLAEELS